MFAVANSVCSLVYKLAFLLFVHCRVFFHHVYLEVRRLGALEIAVSAGKRLLTSVRSPVIFKISR